jgi:hypothetical protein
VTGAENGDVHHVDVDVARLVLGKLLGEPQVDDALHAVLGERAPALIRQPADVVGPNDAAEPRTSTVLGGETAEVTNVDATFPGE